MKDAHDIGLIIDSRIPLIALESYEEKRALELLTRVAMKKRLPLFCWSVTEGLNRLGFGHRVVNGDNLCEPEQALAAIKQERDPAVYVLCDLHPYLRDPKIVRFLKDIAFNYQQAPHTVVLLSHAIELPPELNRLSATFNLSLPTEEQTLAIVREEAKAWSKHNGGHKVKSDSSTLQQLVKNLRGLTLMQCIQRCVCFGQRYAIRFPGRGA